MAGIGDDIKDVLEELGTTATISRIGGSTPVTEKLDYEDYPTHSSEFIRQFFFSATLPWDTTCTTGDIVTFKGLNFIVTNLSESSFEDLPVDKIAAMFRCNVNGVLKRYTEARDTNYNVTKTWAIVSGNPSSVYALQYENKFGMEQMFVDNIQAFLKEQHVLILPSGLNVKEDDRWYPVYNGTDEYYRIASIESRRLYNCLVCDLKEDTRA